MVNSAKFILATLLFAFPAPVKAQPQTGNKKAETVAPNRPEIRADKAPSLGLLERANAYLGTHYRWGGTTPLGFDCSGFVCFVFNPFGINLPRSSASMAQQGEPVRPEAMQKGDLLFFCTTRRARRVNHVGIYLGKGQFIHACSKGSRFARVVKCGLTRPIESPTVEAMMFNFQKLKITIFSAVCMGSLCVLGPTRRGTT
jgi:cell wall-associated NlpC family hydrolase